MKFRNAGLFAILALATIVAIPASESPPSLEESKAFSSAPPVPTAVSIDSVVQLELVAIVAPAFSVTRIAIQRLDSARIQSVLESNRAAETPRAARYTARMTPTLRSHPSVHRNRSDYTERSRLTPMGRFDGRTPVIVAHGNRREGNRREV